MNLDKYDAITRREIEFFVERKDAEYQKIRGQIARDLRRIGGEYGFLDERNYRVLREKYLRALFGTTDKVADAIKLLQKHEPPEGYFLCFSGGKDSVVIYDLAVKSGVKFDAYHNITTVEPPELMKFIR